MAQIYTSLISLFLLHKKGTLPRIKNPFGLKTILWLLPVLLCFKEVQAQAYIADIRKLSVEDGLSNRFVNTIHKDNRGFIWIGTEYGLNRYDGYKFKLYTAENSPLTSNRINHIYEDKDQKLWIVQKKNSNTLGHISILDLQTDSIQTFDQVFKNMVPFSVKDVDHLYSNTLNEIWINTKKGNIYCYRDKRFELIFSTSGRQEESPFFYADDQFLWLDITGEEGKRKILKINIQGQVVKEIELQNGTKKIGIDKNNVLWLFQARQKKLIKINSENDSLQAIDLQSLGLPEGSYTPSFISHYYLNPTDGLIWWYQLKDQNQSTFFVLDPQKGIVSDLQPKVAALFTYTTPWIGKIYLDTGNQAWVITKDGVLIITLKKNKFTTLLSGKSETYSIRGIVEDKQGTLHINAYNREARGIYQKKMEVKKEKYKNTTWLAAARDKQGNLWFGGQNSVIEKYNPLNQKSRYYYTTDSPRDSAQVWSVMPGKTGHIWTGTLSGLYFLDPDTGLYQKFKQYNTFSLLEQSSIYHLHEAEKGIWIASSSGLYLLEPGKGITRRYATDEKIPYRIPYDHLLHFYRDKAGIFWLATKGGGLIRFDPATGSSRQFTTADGLSNNIIYAVYEDDYGKLWLPGNYGLMQFDKNSHRLNTYLKNDGIAHNEFNTISHYQGDNGRLYFGGLAGVTAFDPKDFIAKAPIPAPLRITRCQILNGKTGKLTDKTATVTTTEALEFSPSDKSLLLEFALLNFKNPQTNTYAYKIEGLDHDWTSISTNSLRLNALPYGNYTLLIKGQGIGGEQSANVSSIKLFVRKPFYLKNEFILCSILVLTLLIYGMFRWRVQRLKQSELRLKAIVKQRTGKIQQQKDKLEELNTTQSRWFNNIAHELRTPLTLIHGPIQQFIKKQPANSGEDIQDIQLAGKNTKSLLKLINDILEVSRLDSSQIKLHRTPASISRIIREAAAQFESLARQKGIILASYIHDDLQMNIDKDRIRNILINLISNALKFTHVNGKVTISLQNKREKGIRIRVEDTGDGIPEKDLPHIFERYFQASDPDRINQGGAGIGLSLSLELARLHRGNLTVESQLGEGSIFTLTLPQSLVLSATKPAAMPLTVTLPELPADPVVSTPEDKQNKPLILLVEDNPDMRQYIRRFMDENYRIVEAANGLEALDYLKKATPELIISDIMMPRMDGIALAKTLKADENFKHLPFITLTARTGEPDKIAALRIGIDDYLTKPFNPEELEARAANLIRNYKVRRAVSRISPDEPTVHSYQKKQYNAMKAFVISQIKDSSLSVNDLAASQNMSLSSLSRLLKKQTGLNPSQFIREIRLQHARKFLEARQYPTVLEVTYAVGFENQSHFARRYAERFGKKPSEYL